MLPHNCPVKVISFAASFAKQSLVLALSVLHNDEVVGCHDQLSRRFHLANSKVGGTDTVIALATVAFRCLTFVDNICTIRLLLPFDHRRQPLGQSNLV